MTLSAFIEETHEGEPSVTLVTEATAPCQRITGMAALRVKDLIREAASVFQQHQSHPSPEE